MNNKLFAVNTKTGYARVNKKAMSLVNKDRKKAIKPLNKIWVEGKGLVDIPCFKALVDD